MGREQRQAVEQANARARAAVEAARQSLAEQAKAWRCVLVLVDAIRRGEPIPDLDAIEAAARQACEAAENDAKKV
jgi:hypothetical protein